MKSLRGAIAEKDNIVEENVVKAGTPSSSFPVVICGGGAGAYTRRTRLSCHWELPVRQATCGETFWGCSYLRYAMHWRDLLLRVKAPAIDVLVSANVTLSLVQVGLVLDQALFPERTENTKIRACILTVKPELL